MTGGAATQQPGAARLLIGLLAVLCLAIPVLADTGQSAEEKKAAKVAKKVEKALEKARKAEQEPLEADRRALSEFHEEILEYADLHAKLVAKLGKPATTDAAGAFEVQKALARSIQSKRVGAQQGEILAPDVAPVLRRLIAEQLKGPDAADAQKAVLEGNPSDSGDEGPVVRVVVRVNGEYPPGAARSTVPPTVLLTLPPLPECLHYRFVGRDLLLVDSVAQLIVDFLPAAAPAVATK